MNTNAGTIMERFTGQTAIVTGGATGIGRHVALRLAREGATVAVFDLDRTALDRVVADAAAEGLHLSSHVVDVADEAQVRDAVAAAIPAGGGLDAVVHCAGIVGPNGKRITEVTADEFDRVQRINVRGSFVVTQAAVAAMVPRGAGRVLLFASVAGKEGNAGMCAYSASKAAVIGLAKSVGKEFAESGITINAIAPGVIRTALVDGMDPKQVEYMTSRIPMKRAGTLDEIASLSCWIVSRECSFTTGFCFDLTGGRATY